MKIEKISPSDNKNILTISAWREYNNKIEVFYSGKKFFNKACI